jgi:outer membrane protein assembly factor BamD
MNNWLKNSLIIGIVALSSGLSGCANTNKEDKYNDLSAAQIYHKAIHHAKKKHFKDALEDFEALEARYPFGEYADKALLGEIYSYYANQDYPGALAATDRFIRMYPRHIDIDYAYYIKGVVHYTDALGALSKYLPMPREQRDTQPIKEAYLAFWDLIHLFPDSDYVPNAKKRIIYLRNALANNELFAAQFNWQRQAYLAALNRAQYIILHFDQSPAIKPALVIQLKSARKLGLPDLAEQSFNLLQQNFPDAALELQP